MSTAPLAVNADLTKSIQDAVGTEDIKAAVQAEILKQAADAAAIAATPVAPAAAAVVAPADEEAAKPFSRTETIGGREFSFEAATELELERQVNNAYKVAAGLQVPQVVEPVVDPAVAAAAAEKAATERAAAQADLELKFKRGEVSTQEYLEQSGAVKDYLEKQGVPLDELRASVEQTRQRTYEQSWADATTAFLKSGSDWPGGEKNKKLLGLKIQELGLLDATDKVAAIQQAYAALKQDDLLFANETAAPAAPAAAPVVAAAPVAAAPVAAPAAPTTAPRAASTSSTLFGASSGVSGSGAAAPAASAKIEIDKNATPAEIMAAWKAQQLSEGKDLNAAFTEAFSSRR